VQWSNFKSTALSSLLSWVLLLLFSVRLLYFRNCAVPGFSFFKFDWRHCLPNKRSLKISQFNWVVILHLPNIFSGRVVRYLMCTYVIAIQWILITININSNEKNKSVQYKKRLEDKLCEVLCRLSLAPISREYLQQNWNIDGIWTLQVKTLPIHDLIFLYSWI